MNLVHFTHHDSLTDAMAGFTKLCRESNLDVGLNHTLEALQASELGFLNNEETFRYTLKSLFCVKEEQFEDFNKCFEVYWKKRKHNYAHTIDKKGSTNIAKRTNTSLVMAGFNPNGKNETEAEEEAKSITGASRTESLKATDFSKVASMDSAYLDDLAERLLRQLNHRMKRKMMETKKGAIDLKRTIRKNMSNGGALLELSRKNRKVQKRKIVLILDVSGSMDKYSFYLLKFIWSLKSNLGNIEAFVFSTKLIRITELISTDQLDRALWDLSVHADHWSGGTKIGECIRAFNDQYGKRVLNGRSITIVLSDGLDDGQPELLAGELAKIKMRTSKLLWLNPLKGMQGYAPEAKGMKAALPYLDDFRSAHNLNSLLELENLLADA